MLILHTVSLQGGMALFQVVDYLPTHPLHSIQVRTCRVMICELYYRHEYMMYNRFYTHAHTKTMFQLRTAQKPP